MKTRNYLWITLIIIAVAALLVLQLDKRRAGQVELPRVEIPTRETDTPEFAVTLLPSMEATATTKMKTTTPMSVLPPEDEASGRLIVPDGFAVRIFADDLGGKPRFMAVGPDGHLYISLFNAGSIARLPDRNLDGISDGTEVIASGLNLPHGLEWYNDWLYVAEVDRVSRLQDSDGNGSFDIYEVIISGLPGAQGHSSRTIHFGPDGMLYLSVGSSCNVCVEDDPRRAAILRYSPDGNIPLDNPFADDPDLRKRPLWAWGLRNSVDFLWAPSGQLWANHNGRDNLLDENGNPDTLPPEEIVIPVEGGKSHGWPYCYTPILGVNQEVNGEILDPQSGLPLPEGFNCGPGQVVAAIFTDLAHSAPLGMSLGEGLNFPEEYRTSLFVAYHGSWNTTADAIRDCKVERIVFDGEKPLSGETFVSGWRAAGETCGSASSWGRPADVISGADGALYISDDKGGRVYRVVFIGD